MARSTFWQAYAASTQPVPADPADLESLPEYPATVCQWCWGSGLGYEPGDPRDPASAYTFDCDGCSGTGMRGAA